MKFYNRVIYSETPYISNSFSVVSRDSFAFCSKVLPDLLFFWNRINFAEFIYKFRNSPTYSTNTYAIHIAINPNRKQFFSSRICCLFLPPSVFVNKPLQYILFSRKDSWLKFTSTCKFIVINTHCRTRLMADFLVSIITLRRCCISLDVQNYSKSI